MFSLQQTQKLVQQIATLEVEINDKDDLLQKKELEIDCLKKEIAELTSNNNEQ